MAKKVLILGGTGQIGTQVTRALVDRGLQVSILCRSDKSSVKARKLKAHPIPGDIKTPEAWAAIVPSFDAVVHVAATFDDDIADVDDRLITMLLARMSRKQKLLYTGGVWLFGNTEALADESAPYNPPAEWMWMAENSQRVLESTTVNGMVIHPANVVEARVGVPGIMLEEARRTGVVRIPVSERVTWPLVSSVDLAQLYALVLEKGYLSESYIGSSVPTVPVGDIARRVSEHLGLADEPVATGLEYWMKEYGSWASGYGLSQSLVSNKAQKQLGWKPEFTFSISL